MQKSIVRIFVFGARSLILHTVFKVSMNLNAFFISFVPVWFFAPNSSASDIMSDKFFEGMLGSSICLMKNAQNMLKMEMRVILNVCYINDVSCCVLPICINCQIKQITS